MRCRHLAGALLGAGTILLGFLACARSADRNLPTGPAEEPPPFTTTAPTTARDSALAADQLARFLAVALSDSTMRTALLEASGRETTLRRALREMGSDFTSAVERSNHLAPGILALALANLPDFSLELGGAMTPGAELLVAISPFMPDSTKAAIGYDERGWEQPLTSDARRSNSVLWLVATAPPSPRRPWRPR